MAIPPAFRPFAASRLLPLFGLLALAAAADRSHAQHLAATAPAAHDEVAAAIAEASRRFGVPEQWIRSVMRVESAGDASAVSRAGAMGLMQVMPATYAELRNRHGLGTNPFAIRENILAGTAYLREMYDRYGAPGFLAAYNAGPGRWEAYLRRARPLPGETVDYLARLTPAIGHAAPSPALEARPLRILSPGESPLFVASRSASPETVAVVAEDHSASRNPPAVATSNGPFVRRDGGNIAPSSAAFSGIDASTAAPVTSRPQSAERVDYAPRDPLFVRLSTTGPR